MKGRIAGTITDKNGNAMSGAAVQLFSNWDGAEKRTPALIKKGTTITDGSYAFSGLDVTGDGITYTVYYLDGTDQYFVGQYTLTLSNTEQTGADLKLS